MRRRRWGSTLCLVTIILGLFSSTGDVSDPQILQLPSVILNNDGLGLESLPDPPSSRHVSQPEVSKLPALIPNQDGLIDRPAARSLLTHNPEVKTQLIATLDGKVQLVDINSGKILWSFSSGSPIYTSYQAPTDDDNDLENASGLSHSFYLDYGENWELLAHHPTGMTKAVRGGIEEFFNTLPNFSDDGGVIVGSKNTKVFVLDAMTGKLIRTYQSPSTLLSDEEKSAVKGSEESGSLKQNNVMLPLYITRTDYLVRGFAPNSSEVSWNMTVAEMEAAIICRDIKNPFGSNTLHHVNELGSESGNNFVMPLPCQTKAVVIRPPLTSNLLESSASNKRLPKDNNEKLMLPDNAPTHMLPLQPTVKDSLDFNHEKVILSLPASTMPPPRPKHDKVLDLFHSHNHNDLVISRHHSELKSSVTSGHDLIGMLSAVAGIVFFVGLFIWKVLTGRKQADVDKQLANVDIKSGPAKKKKIRKSGKNSGITEKKDTFTSSEIEDGYALVPNKSTPLLDLNKLIGGGVDGRRIGKLFISSKEIAKGSNGTIVLEGIYDGRPVAVKRLVQAHHDVAIKEIQNLIASDRHPNIVRWYGVEHDQDFVYLSLERCSCSLDDLIQISNCSSQNALLAQEQSSRAMLEYTVRLHSMKGLMRDINLWKANGYPSLVLLQLMRDVVSGLVHLHELGIVHRDLKPQNVLINEERSLCAKLSDMGISKRLHGDMSSLDHHATGCGSSGWQAPEQLNHGRQTRAVDLFSLGCVLFFCITGGRHPFGDRLERDINIVKNQMDLFLVEHIPDAVDLLSQLLNPDPELRPKAFAVLHHPLFWSSEMRLSFLRDTSDRVELEDREADSDILKALESKASVALGTKWDEKLEPAFINNIGRYRRYKFDSVRDLLRVIRNKLNHYRELPQEIQELLGPVPEGFDGYFASRFPKLLIEVYKVVHRYCREEECFQKYFKGQIV